MNNFQKLLREWFEDPGQVNMIHNVKVLRNPPIKALDRIFPENKPGAKRYVRFLLKPNLTPGKAKFSTIHCWNANQLTHDDVFDYFDYEYAVSGIFKIHEDQLELDDELSGLYCKVNKPENREKIAESMKEFDWYIALEQFPREQIDKYLKHLTLY